MSEHAPIRQAFERTPLPQREAIDAMSDPVAIQDLIDEVAATASKIEVDLEFRSDDGATDGWEARARAALTAHRICLGNLRKRLHRLSGAPQANLAAQAAKAEAKAQNVAAQVGLSQAANERKALQLEKQRIAADEHKVQAREKTRRATLSLIDRTSFLGAFMGCAHALLPAERYAEILAAAQARHRADIEAAMAADEASPPDAAP